jgi:non-specific serine/threonine protein kinase
LTPLIGRQQELAFVSDLIGRKGARLISLTGPGGIGKTRLAMAVATEVADGFPDGVAWLPLAAITDPDLVLPGIARALGVAEGRGRGALEAVIAALRDRQMMLVLDNFEQVAAAGSQVTDLLLGCPRLVVLVTSRETLRVRGEYAVPVPPLALSAPDDSDAVTLFVDRATAVQPGFALEPANATAIAEICARLDGLPLAIELAAARVTHLSLETLRARMDRRLPLLTGGARDLPARQRTLRDAIAWSYDLLSLDERALLRRLSVFTDGFTLDAAEAVGGCIPEGGGAEGSKDHPSTAVLNMLGSLVDKSLVRHEQDGRRDSRYRLLETIREFAAEELAASGDKSAARAAQAGWMLGLAERLETLPFMPADAGALRVLDTEFGNLRVALAWLATDDTSDGFVRMVRSVSWYWWSRGHWHEARQWLRQAWERFEGGVRGAESARGAEVLAVWYGVVLASGAGDLDEAERVLRVGLHAARGGEDSPGAVPLMICLGWVANLRGDHAGALPRMRAALGQARRVPDPRQNRFMVATALNNLGGTCRVLGSFDDARASFEEAMAMMVAADAPLGIAQNRFDLGLMARDLGELEVAESYFREGLRATMAVGGLRYLVMAFEGLGTVEAAAGDATNATRLFAMMQRVRDIAGMVEDVPLDRAVREAAMARTRRALGEDGFAAAWESGYALKPEMAAAEVLATESTYRPDAAPTISLTAREQQILPLLAIGLSDRAIGEALFIGERTVESHVRRIYGKLGVRTRAGATAVAVANGLVDPWAAAQE